jgi:ABC-type branched-subunit amino acid transport system substrate-binding protein/streptogramin lyase/predicted Ser/Thr protein kinase
MSVALGPGSTFAGYRVESLLGRGGMGVLYRATDLSLDRPVALKLIAPELAEDERFRGRFLKEPRLAAALDHPHVVPIYEAGEYEGQLFLVMRYVEGRDLKSVLEHEGSLAPERALAVLSQVADALDAAHRRGLVHRDVKPANVLLDEDDHAYLTDFGISKQLGGASTDTRRVVGTLDYLAPEQIRGEKVDGRTDCYALACVLYECLAGAPPFQHETEAETLWAHMQEPPPGVPGYPELDAVLGRGLAKEKEGRYASCGELVAAAASALGFEPPARRARRLRVGRRLLLAGAVLLLAAVAAAGVRELTRDDEESADAVAQIAPDSVGVLDPAANRVVDQVPIPGPSLVAAHGRSVWVGNTTRTLSRIDANKLSVTDVVPANATADDLVATKDAAWLLDLEGRVLVKVDAAYGSDAKRVPLPALKRPAHQAGAGVAAGRGAVWVAPGTRRLLKLNQRDARVVRTVDLRRPVDDVALGTGAVWAISSASARVLQLDPRSGSVRARIPLVARPGLTSPAPVAVVAGEGAVWVLNHNIPSVSRIDPQLGAVTATIRLGIGSNPSAIATGAGAVWVALSGEGTVVRIDPNGGNARSIPVGGAPTGVAVGQGRVWISVQPGVRAGPAARSRTIRMPGAVSQNFCTPVEFADNGSPRFLLVSDLPLQAPPNLLPTLQYTDAVRFVLARRDFRAGAYSVGYQSCDSSSAASVFGPTPATCRRNARAFANAPAVLGVIGPYTSGCASVELPILNAARSGPLAAVSATASVVGLTHEGPATSPGEPRSYYPRGVRNFARVVAADDIQGAAHALMAKQLGIRSLYVLNDQKPYGIAVAASVRKTARKLGIGIAGSADYNRRGRSFKDVAKRIERTGADGVFLGGTLALSRNEGGSALVRDLRAVLGRRVQILAPDGFAAEALIQQAGPAAEGVVVSVPVADPARLPPTGRRFVEAFEQAIEGQAAPSSAPTAQATEVLLDAIARSDGTRASVTRNLLRTRVKNGILGSFEFDTNGDTTAGGVTMYRIENGKPRVLAVLNPPKSLR